MIKGIRYPIIQAPMAGGISTATLASSVSKAGGLGFLAGGYKNIEELQNEIEIMKSQDLIFGVNIFVPSDEEINYEDLTKYKKILEKDLNIKLIDPKVTDDFWNEKLALVKKYKVPFVSFTFGCPNRTIIKDLQANDIKVIVTVTSLEEAKEAIAEGTDFLCIQGIEAGGHRGSFQNSDCLTDKTLKETFSEIKAQTTVPLIVAGGIMNGKQVEDYLNNGAAAVQMGTAFICTKESGANEVYKQALLQHKFKRTAFTRAFTGRLAQGLENEFMIKHANNAPRIYPAINFMTQAIRKEALKNNNPQHMSLWAGIGFKEVRDLSVIELIDEIVEEAHLSRINGQ